MNSIFKRENSFDTIIGDGTVLLAKSLFIKPGSTTVIDGNVVSDNINVDPNILEKADRTSLVINGSVQSYDITVPNVIVTGKLSSHNIKCKVLAIKKGAVLNVQTIVYESLVMETGAIVHGKLVHHDPKAGDQASS